MGSIGHRGGRVATGHARRRADQAGPHFHQMSVPAMSAIKSSRKSHGTFIPPRSNDPRPSPEDKLREPVSRVGESVFRVRPEPTSRSMSRPPLQGKSNFGHSHPESPPFPNSEPNLSSVPSFSNASKKFRPLLSVSASIASLSLTRSRIARCTAGDSSIGPTFFSHSAVAASAAFVLAIFSGESFGAPRGFSGSNLRFPSLGGSIGRSVFGSIGRSCCGSRFGFC